MHTTSNVLTALLISGSLAALAAAQDKAPQEKPVPPKAPVEPAKPAEAGKNAPSPWIADFDAAVKVAKEQKKDLLVDFTGSDWCTWCKKLDAEVFSHEEFLSAAQKEFVLVALDFPDKEEIKAKVPNPKRNDELLRKWAVHGFPTVLLVTPDGDLFGRTGYDEGGPVRYAESLETLRVEGKKTLDILNALGAKLAAAQGDEKLQWFDEAMAQAEALDDESPFSLKVAALLRTANDFDADNKLGKKLAALNELLKKGLVAGVDVAVAQSLDAKNADGLFERVVYAFCASVSSKDDLPDALKAIDDLLAAGPFQDKEIEQELLIRAMFWNYKSLDKKDAARKYAQRLKDLNLDDEKLRELLDEVLKS